MPNCVAVGQSVRSYLRRSADKIWILASRLSRSLKVICTVTDQSDICGLGLLVVIHSNHGPISYRFRRTTISVEIRNFFPPPVHLAPTLSGFPFEFRNGSGSQKARLMPLADGSKSLTIDAFIWTQQKWYINTAFCVLANASGVVLS